ncbi:MAG TPA: alpha/beta fold hydrolase [Desulfomicrobiaceae bacterium]|nr:alpha/beta fold hydrolase [Desulfomicrobiaceae bacterium]
MLTSFPFNNGHVQTILPALLRRGPAVGYARERIWTSDNDFLDLDWSRQGNSRVAVVLHGLEGSSTRAYVRGMVHALNEHGWDCVAMNFRGCSGEPNQKLSMYHSGLTEDLDTVLRHVQSRERYAGIALVGFSMGANQILKYLGEAPDRVPEQVVGACAISVPCDLEGAAHALARPANSMYMHYFLRSLRQKIRQKAAMFPGALDTDGLDEVRTFAEFDDRYTAPMHGFANALDYWRKSSSLQVLGNIDRPSFVLNAADDPFLSPGCFPFRDVEQNPFLHLEVPATGGHCGFLSLSRNGLYFLEQRVLAFLDRVDSSSVPREIYE